MRETRFPILLMARRNITRTQFRSTLAVLGIIVGVVAIASLGIFGASLQQSATASFDEFGSDLVVHPATEEGVSALTERDLRYVEQTAQGEVIPLKQSEGQIATRGDERYVTIYGTSSPGAAFSVDDGQVMDPHRQGVIVGAEIADDMELNPGETITVKNETYTVHATLERHDQWAPVPTNDAIVVPEDDVDREGYQEILVREESGDVANATAQEIDGLLNHRETRVSILEMVFFEEEVSEFFEILNYFLIGIGALSLIVAGVSILNIMMMGIIERREEIGVLRAVGYHKRDIVKLIITEATILGVIGGIIGIALSVMMGLAINWSSLNDPMFTFTPRNLFYIGLAFWFALATSMLSGAYPAWKAANERPVDVLGS